MSPQRPDRSRRRPLIALAMLVLALGSCTFRASKQLEVDFLGARYRVYVYEKPTALLAVELRDVCRNRRGADRRSWARCSLEFLHDHVDVPSLGRHEWGAFTGLDQWDDYGGAVDAIVRGGFSTDSQRQRYARNCLVGDHLGFQDYNWTTRAASDGHCRRGSYPS